VSNSKPAKPLVDTAFTAEVARFYESTLVPLIFETYAHDLAIRASNIPSKSILEVACGTGVVTRALSKVLPDDCLITATDLNDAMVRHAEKLGAGREVDWAQADVMKLPYESESFDLVLCQFSVMFFPDRVAAYKEIQRVLKPGGKFMFNVWNRIEENHFAHEITECLTLRYPENPPLFLARTPHGHGHPDEIKSDLEAAGFSKCEIIQKDAFSHAKDATVPVIAYCHGTPLRVEIEEREPGGLARVTEVVTDSIKTRFGQGEISGKISAVVVTAS
jgi:ubiquinone/menaquinone biosynthesis C-methylase UbiE